VTQHRANTLTRVLPVAFGDAGLVGKPRGCGAAAKGTSSVSALGTCACSAGRAGDLANDVLLPGRTEWEAARAAAGLQTAASEDMHAGELEVSLLLHTYPELVGKDFRHRDWQAHPRPHLLVTGMRGYTESGVIGRPSLATAEKGRALLDSLARSFKDHLALSSLRGCLTD
jgi:hypothetical protein